MLGGKNSRFCCVRLWREEFLKTWLRSIILRPNCLVHVLLCTCFLLCLRWVFFYCPIDVGVVHKVATAETNKQKQGQFVLSQSPTACSSVFHTGTTDTPTRQTLCSELQAQRSISEIVFSEVINHSHTKYRWKKPRISALYSQFIYGII